MKPVEIVERIKKENPLALGNIPDQRAARIIFAALAQLGKHIDAMSDGVLKVPGLGNFRVRKIEREKEGKKVMVKRTIFVAKGPKK